jgi:hypothetical protein
VSHTTSERRRERSRADRYARTEADLRATWRSGDPGALELADHYRRCREETERRLDCNPAAVESLPLFSEKRRP